jgi:hypothetical protein
MPAGESALLLRQNMRTRFLCWTYRIAFALLFFILIAYLIVSREGGVSMD